MRLNGDEQRRICREIATDYRYLSIEQLRKAIARTIVAAFFVLSAVTVSAVLLAADWKNFVELLLPYFGSKLSGAFGWLDGSEGTSFYAQVGWMADLMITFTLNVILGSWVIFIASFLSSLFFATVFPTRWVKLLRVERYWMGSHNRFGLLFRKIKILISSRQRLAPTTGDFLYGNYEIDYNPPWYLKVFAFFL